MLRLEVGKSYLTDGGAKVTLALSGHTSASKKWHDPSLPNFYWDDEGRISFDKPISLTNWPPGYTGHPGNISSTWDDAQLALAGAFSKLQKESP